MTRSLARVFLVLMLALGAAVTITVEVRPVPGEKNTTNNSQDFSALFSRS